MERAYDEPMERIAYYVCDAFIKSDEAFETARLALADSLGCALYALKYPECSKLLGPYVKGTLVPNGSRVPGTNYILDPVLAAFNIGSMIRWLDFNDTWLAAEWGHPSDNLGGILAIADFVSRQKRAQNHPPLLVKDVLTAAIKAYEIQGVLALLNSFNKEGLDHVILNKVATAAVAAYLLGGSFSQVKDALSQAFIDLGPMRTYRHFPNTGSRKSWAAGDATSRGVQLAIFTLRGEMGYPTALTAKQWGLYDVIFQGKPFEFQRDFGSYVMENILFKIAYPAEFHAQTAVEAACLLHPEVKDRLNDIEAILIETQKAAIQIIDKKGPLHNPADRDHCLQYMVAIGLIHGTLNAEHYEQSQADHPMIDFLRAKMDVAENIDYTKNYYDPEKRSIGNRITIRFKNGLKLNPLGVEYPIGHKNRRKEAIPLLFQKLDRHLRSCFDERRSNALLHLFQDHEKLLTLPVDVLMDLLYKKDYNNPAGF